MRRFSQLILAAGALTVAAMAGGFWLELGKPEASKDAKAKGSAVIVRALGCGQPAQSLISATAEGYTSGRRTSIPLKSVALSDPGVFALFGDIPQNGKWVIRVTGSYEGHTVGAVAPLGPQGFVRASTKYMSRAPIADDVEQSLKAIATN